MKLFVRKDVPHAIDSNSSAVKEDHILYGMDAVLS
jgi:hypothetical protein